MFRAGKTVLPIIDSILADPALLTLDKIGEMRALQAVIQTKSPIVIHQRKAMCIIAIVYSLIYALAGLAGLWLIKMLRESESLYCHVPPALHR